MPPINNEPNGTNINTDCGSTHIEKLQAFVKEKGLDVGFAFDGDADRCLAVDDKGEIVDGMCLSKSNSSKVVASLLKRGYVRRVLCKEDGRSCRFHLTPAGEELLQRVHGDQVQLPEELQELISRR